RTKIEEPRLMQGGRIHKLRGTVGDTCCCVRRGRRRGCGCALNAKLSTNYLKNQRQSQKSAPAHSFPNFCQKHTFPFFWIALALYLKAWQYPLKKAKSILVRLTR